MIDSQAKSRSRRRGFMSMELALTLPILLIVLLGMLEFSMLFFARGSVLEASRLAARRATFPGATRDVVLEEVEKVLSQRLASTAEVITEIGENTGDVVSVIIVVPMSTAAPDLLWPIGYSLEGQSIVAETRMIRE